MCRYVYCIGSGVPIGLTDVQRAMIMTTISFIKHSTLLEYAKE